MSKNKTTPIYQLLNLLTKHEYVSRTSVNSLVWSRNSTALINSLKSQWHHIESVKTTEELKWYKYTWYTMPFPKLSRSIDRNFPVLKFVVRALYFIVFLIYEKK